MASNSDSQPLHTAQKSLKIGDSFSTFQAVTDAMKELENQEAITYWRRDSRTFEGAKSKIPNLISNDALEYYEVKFACLKGGRSYQKKSTGARPNQRYVGVLG